MTTFLAAARQEPVINAGKVETKPPAKECTAWTVTEIHRSWPTEADAAAIDPATITVSGTLVFDDFNLAAKLTRSGIDGTWESPSDSPTSSSSP